jgi:hypothetical protein
MRNASRTVSVVLISLMIAACAIFVKAEVSRFNSLPPDYAGKAFYIVPLKDQQGSAEFQVYARSVAARLSANGFREAGTLGDADYAVIFNYGVGRARQISGSVPLYGQTGGGTTYHHGTASAHGTGGSAVGSYSGYSRTSPTYGVVGSMPYSRTEYGRYFQLKIVDQKRSTKDNMLGVYEGVVKSAGRSSTFGAVSGCLMDALFENFFETGTTRTTLSAQRCMK